MFLLYPVEVIGGDADYPSVVSGSRGKRIVLSFLAAVMIAGMSAPAAARVRTRTTKIARGVKHTRIVDSRGPQRIHVVTVSPRRATLRVGLAQNRLQGFETTSSMARRHRAVAAINGDYAELSGRPVMTFARRGRLAQTAQLWGSNFAVNVDQTRSFIGHPRVAVSLAVPDAAKPSRIARVNRGVPSKALALFTRASTGVELPPRRSCSARLHRRGMPRFAPSGPGVEIRYRVSKVVCRYRRLRLQDGVVVSARRRAPASEVIRSLAPDTRVTLSWSLGWKRVAETVGGNPTLLRNGRVVIGDGAHYFHLRHPRTGVGTTADGKVLLVTVDGRRPGYSVGMKPPAFARLFRRLGATTAVNLDGGGSTTMWVRGRVRNRPSDGRERAVSSALLVLAGAPESRRPVVAEPAPEPAPAGTAAEIVSDPASTGGLASALAAEGRSLPAALGQVGRAFDRLWGRPPSR